MHEMPASVSEPEEEAILNGALEYARKYMARYDGSHDFHHVERVLALALSILKAETQQGGDFDEYVVRLAAVLHDIGDKKYLEAGDDPSTMVENVLLDLGAEEALAVKVQEIVTHVSYSTEVADPSKVRVVISKHPELAIVQDADRLDALGAVGIGRCFMFGGVKGRGLDDSVEHFEEKLERLEGMMKTTTGKEMAWERTKRIKTFRKWYEEEQGFGVKPEVHPGMAAIMDYSRLTIDWENKRIMLGQTEDGEDLWAIMREEKGGQQSMRGWKKSRGGCGCHNVSAWEHEIRLLWENLGQPDLILFLKRLWRRLFDDRWVTDSMTINRYLEQLLRRINKKPSRKERILKNAYGGCIDYFADNDTHLTPRKVREAVEQGLTVNGPVEVQAIWILGKIGYMARERIELLAVGTEPNGLVVQQEMSAKPTQPAESGERYETGLLTQPALSQSYIDLETEDEDMEDCQGSLMPQAEPEAYREDGPVCSTGPLQGGDDEYHESWTGM